MDELLRRLGRGARPDDLAAGHAHVRALERAGDATGAWLTRCRLARESAPGAWEALEPGPGAALRAAPRVTAELLLRERVELAPTGSSLVALRGYGVLDGQDLAPRWRLTPRASVACSGPRSIEATSSAVRVRDLRDGTLLGEGPLPPGETPTIQSLLAAGDRALVAWRDFRPGGEWRLLVVDLGVRPGRVLVDRPMDSLWCPDTVVGGLVLFDDQRAARSVTACDLAGAERWSVEGALLAADGRGAVLDLDDRREEGPPGKAVREVDLETGGVRWTAPELGPGATLLGREVVLRLGPPRASHGVLAVGLRRSDGAVAWERPLTELRAVLLGQHVADGVGYVAMGEPRDAPSARPRLLALDLATGALLFEREVATPPGWEAERWHRRVQLQPVGDALVVVASTHLDARLERWAP